MYLLHSHVQPFLNNIPPYTLRHHVPDRMSRFHILAKACRGDVEERGVNNMYTRQMGCLARSMARAEVDVAAEITDNGLPLTPLVEDREIVAADDQVVLCFWFSLLECTEGIDGI